LISQKGRPQALNGFCGVVGHGWIPLGYLIRGEIRGMGFILSFSVFFSKQLELIARTLRFCFLNRSRFEIPVQPNFPEFLKKRNLNCLVSQQQDFGASGTH
jgi:hypothetical protein